MKQSQSSHSEKNEEQMPVHWVQVKTLPASGLEIDIVAKESEKPALADYLDIEALGKLETELRLTRWKRDGIKIVGRIRAKLVQQCAISLQAVDSNIDEEFTALFVPVGSKLAKPQIAEDGEMVLDPDGDDLPDSFTGDKLDMWQVILEHLQLAIDPFVRAEGIEFDEIGFSDEEGDADSGGQESPFAVLKNLKTPKNT